MCLTVLKLKSFLQGHFFIKLLVISLYNLLCSASFSNVLQFLPVTTVLYFRESSYFLCSFERERETRIKAFEPFLLCYLISYYLFLFNIRGQDTSGVSVISFPLDSTRPSTLHLIPFKSSFRVFSLCRDHDRKFFGHGQRQRILVEFDGACNRLVIHWGPRRLFHSRLTLNGNLPYFPLEKFSRFSPSPPAILFDLIRFADQSHWKVQNLNLNAMCVCVPLSPSPSPLLSLSLCVGKT